MKYKIPLIFYGESEAEYGNPIAETQTSLRDKSYYTMQNLSEVCLAGIPIPELMKQHDLSLNDLMPYLPSDYHELEQNRIEVHYLGYTSSGPRRRVTTMQWSTPDSKQDLSEQKARTANTTVSMTRLMTCTITQHT